MVPRRGPDIASRTKVLEATHPGEVFDPDGGVVATFGRVSAPSLETVAGRANVFHAPLSGEARLGPYGPPGKFQFCHTSFLAFDSIRQEEKRRLENANAENPERTKDELGPLKEKSKVFSRLC